MSLRVRTKVEVTPVQAIAVRQSSIYKLATTGSLILLVVWSPILLLPRGTGIRPMLELPLSILFVLCATAIGTLRAIHQLVAAWPIKRLGLKALAAALVPLAFFVFLQWLTLYVRGIVYES